MTADPEITAGLASISTKLEGMDSRAVEDRRAGIEAREKIDEIHGTTRVLAERLDSHIRDDDRRFNEHTTDIDRAHAKASKAGVSKGQAGGAVAGAGMIGAILDRVWQWFVSGGPTP